MKGRARKVARRIVRKHLARIAKKVCVVVVSLRWLEKQRAYKVN